VLTTKAFTRVKADVLLVYNEFNKKEAVRYGDYAKPQVTVTGFPQFDIYTDESIFLSREEFMHRAGLDPARRYALYGIPGDWKSPDTRPILSMLDAAVNAGKFAKPFQILARFHPKYRDSSEGLASQYIVFDRPGVYFGHKSEFSIDSGKETNRWTFKDDDIIHLANSIRHADIVICVDSTLALDAAANGRGAIIVAYDGGRKVPYKRSIAYIYEREHYQNIIKSGGVVLVKNHDDLVQTINHFLEDTEYRKTGREKTAREMLFAQDGNSGRRMGEAILALIDK
jgi:hypothetical protein